VKKKVNPGFRTTELNVDRDGSRLFLLDRQGGRIVVFDTKTETILKFITVKRPVNVVSDPDGKKLYVTGGETGNIYVVDKILGRVISTSKIGLNLFDLLIVQ